MFLCCHPDLPHEARVALSLKTVGGFSTPEIARAFLTSDSTIAQRIVRAKRLLRERRPAFELPAATDLAVRVDSVLEVIYLMFNEGYAAHAGEDLVRLDVCREALRLARLVAESPLGGPAAHALVSLIAFQASRIPARMSEAGEMVLLEDQDRARWDRTLIGLGFAHLARSADGERMTPYHVQAAIAAVHAGAATAAQTDWPRVLSLYDDLWRLQPTPIVALNRTVALARVRGEAEALGEVDRLESEGALKDYYLLPAVKATLLQASGDTAGAAAALLEALARPCSEPEKRLLVRRLAACR